jgi:hypothetical protein
MQFEVSRKIMYWCIAYPLARANILPVCLSIFILTSILLDSSHVYGHVNLLTFVLYCLNIFCCLLIPFALFKNAVNNSGYVVLSGMMVSEK